MYRLHNAGSPAVVPGALGFPTHTKQIKIETHGHSGNTPEYPLQPDCHPLVVKIAKKDGEGGGVGAKKVQK